jgi:protease PrsW
VVSFPVAPQQPRLYPGLPLANRKVGAPLAVIIGLGTLTGLIVILLTAVNPVGTAIGFVLSSVAITGVVLAYLWLDRWEPEPPQLLVLAFVAHRSPWSFRWCWGSTSNPFLGRNATESPGFVSVAIAAPLIEEAAKGLFLLIMMTGRRRNELNSMTDCLVYAGITAAGFTWAGGHPVHRERRTAD